MSSQYTDETTIASITTSATERTAMGDPRSDRASTACTLRNQPEAAKQARSFARGHMVAWGAEESVIYDATVIVTELVSNAILHSGADRISVRLSYSSPELSIYIADTGSWRHRCQQTGGCDQAESGRGLNLIAAIARQSGVRRTVNGTCAWATLLMSGPGP